MAMADSSEDDAWGTPLEEAVQLPGDQEHRALTQKLSVPRDHIFDICYGLAEENLRYFQSSRMNYANRYANCCSEIRTLIDEGVGDLVASVQSVAHEFDLDEKTPGNGYRSIVCVTDTCILHLIRLLRMIAVQRNSIVFRSAFFCKELEAYVAILQFMKDSISRIVAHFDDWPRGHLFPKQTESLKTLLEYIDNMDGTCFYGRATAFQFCATMSRVFQVIGIALAAYSVNWDKGSGALSSLTSLMHSGKLMLSPELRAKRITDVTTHADIGLCKGFWNLSDGTLLQQVPKWFCPQVAVNEVLSIPAEESLFVDGIGGYRIEVPPPSAHTGKRPISSRLMALTFRRGMKVADHPSLTHEKSPYLLFHCHGGGYVATSSRAHESYLRHWVKQLDCPLLSIDYSLAPENPYPRPLEEVLYAYAWALNNADSLGWTGEKVCFAGDSAGGNLVTAATLKAITMGFRRLPDGLMLIYTPFLCQCDPSPSRLLSVMDPLLPTGILVRCLLAYAGFYGTSSTSCDKDSQNVHKSLQEYFEELMKENKHRGAPNLDDDQDIVSLVNLQSAPPNDQAEEYIPVVMDRSGIEKKNTGNSISEVQNTTVNRRVTFGLDIAQGSSPEDSSDESEVWEEAEEEVELVPLQRRSKSVGTFEENCKNVGEERGKCERSKSLQHNTWEGIEPGKDALEESEGPTVEIHKDPSRIWLSSSIYDHEFVDYLSRHEKTKNSLVLMDVGDFNPRAPENGKVLLKATASVGVDSDEVAELPRKEEIGRKIIGRSRSKSMGNLRKTWSMTFTDTVALATGHFLDNLSGLVEPHHVPKRRKEDGCSEKSQEQANVHPLTVLRNVSLPKDPFMSPLHAPDEWLKRLPKIHLLACHLDPLLDDSVEFARKVRGVGGEVGIDMLDSLPHGFLNFTLVSPECREAAKLCLNRIKKMMGIKDEK